MLGLFAAIEWHYVDILAGVHCFWYGEILGCVGDVSAGNREVAGIPKRFNWCVLEGCNLAIWVHTERKVFGGTYVSSMEKRPVEGVTQIPSPII